MSQAALEPARPPGTTPEAAAVRGRRRRESLALYLLPGAALFVAVILIPMGMNVWYSLHQWYGIGPMKWVGLQNYVRLFHDSTFWTSFEHQVGLVLAMAVVPTVVGLVLAAGLFDYIGARFGGRTAGLLRACIYLPQVMPLAVMGVVWGWILNPRIGALNGLLGDVGLGSLRHDWLGDPRTALYTVMAVMVWVQIGFPLVIFMAGMQRIDPSLHEAAEVDGADWWQRFFRITVPIMRPETYVVLLMTTIGALKSFAAIYTLTQGGPGTSTNVPSYYSYANFFETTRVGYGAAIATVMTVITVVVTLVLLRLQSRQQEVRD
ncbi:carbohydrate ABC transporter permease [Actinacidiphila yeochonensis]|uniref:carbohydrate ABC transporter permease n=1 Tax=Actinacidiphila yeochonensis TaxID=89050 RepID=UPI00055EBAED|nr:sugar ABC transporter permease [Actinacidiphila yeochonensis]